MSRNLIHKNQLPETFVKKIAKNLITSMEKLECVNYYNYGLIFDKYFIENCSIDKIDCY